MTVKGRGHSRGSWFFPVKEPGTSPGCISGHFPDARPVPVPPEPPEAEGAKPSKA